jgi:hypothetical protein
MTSRIGWCSIGAAVVIGVVGLRLLINRVAVQSTEISAVRSPDGRAYAVLLDIPQDARGAHSARVCLSRSRIRLYAQSICTDVAYLSGVPASDSQLGINLEWTSSTELEIRYREAAAVHLYHPTFVWPNAGRPAFYRNYAQSSAPIHSSLVHANIAGDGVPLK